jgi:hypothetical protein
MKRNRKTDADAGLSALYARLDGIRMSAADRANAKAALAQADALADTIIAVSGFAKRLFGARPLHATSAHG